MTQSEPDFHQNRTHDPCLKTSTNRRAITLKHNSLPPALEYCLTVYMRGSREADFFPSSQPYVALTEVNIIDYFDNEFFFTNVIGAVKLLCVGICPLNGAWMHATNTPLPPQDPVWNLACMH